MSIVVLTKTRITMRINSKLSAMFVMAAVMLMISASCSTAQENFSGKWAINESKSTMPQLPGGGQGQGQGQGRAGAGGMRLAAPEMTVTQQGENLSVEKVMPGRDGQTRTTTEKYDLAGKVTENAGMMNQNRKSRVSWSSDKKVMTIASTITVDMQGQYFDINSSEIWKLSDGGKTLTIESVTSTQMGEIKSTLVYDKK